MAEMGKSIGQRYPYAQAPEKDSPFIPKALGQGSSGSERDNKGSTTTVPTTEITEQQTKNTGCRNHLQPLNAVEALLEQMEHFPLVALGEVHQLQEFYDFLTALLYHPLLPEKITDIVVEFGNAHYQEIADRLVLALSTVKWYINAVYGKLQVTSRTKAIARARELNIR